LLQFVAWIFRVGGQVIKIELDGICPCLFDFPGITDPSPVETPFNFQ